MAAILDRFLTGLANLSLLRQRRANSYCLILRYWELRSRDACSFSIQQPFQGLYYKNGTEDFGLSIPEERLSIEQEVVPNHKADG